ncbi:MAG: hypothetical protein K6V73_07205 [Firmicutes bacterium]|nr:hypothetical protein [Bacillota bacterium]
MVQVAVDLDAVEERVVGGRTARQLVGAAAAGAVALGLWHALGGAGVDVRTGAAALGAAAAWGAFNVRWQGATVLTWGVRLAVYLAAPRRFGPGRR